MSPDSVEEAIAGGNAHPAPSLGHGGTVRPLVGVGVKTLHRLEA